MAPSMQVPPAYEMTGLLGATVKGVSCGSGQPLPSPEMLNV
jgi:hypothetical protein